MNPHLIQKLIKQNNENAPEFAYTNPLLDPNVAKALSKSFVNILTSEQNSNVSNNLRQSILENIRKICKSEPEDHVTLNEDHTKLVVDFYKDHVMDVEDPDQDSLDKELDAFLMRNFKELNINSNYTTNINPEILQALMNLSIDINEKSFTDNIIHWDTDKKGSVELINNLWNQTNNSFIINDIVIKMKPVIEKLLIDISLNMMEDEQFDTNAEISNEEYQRLFKTCAISPHCFEISIYVLNLLLLSTNFNGKLLQLIEIFISNVRLNCTESISSLYPIHLSHIVVFLDVEFNNFPEDIQKQYIDISMKYLKDLQNKSDSDYVMLLSHFPQWFELSVNA